MSKVLSIVVGTLITGAANSLFTKYQDNQCVHNCLDPDVSNHQYFNQPAIQTMQMFVGEFLVIVAYYFMYRSRLRLDYTPIGDSPKSNDRLFHFPSKLALVAFFDLCGTTLLNIGLVYTPVSVYQMMRGSVVLFVAFFSVVFLKRRITKLEWMSLFLVSLGVAIVGFSGIGQKAGAEAVDSAKAASESALLAFGVCLIVLASLLQACQFVIEEFVLGNEDIVPMKIVYSEGFYGLVIIIGAMVVLNFIIGAIQPPSQFERSPFNIVESFSQVVHNKEVMMSSVCIMCSIALFNFCGISITHMLSATSRSTVDTCRTLIVWLLAIIMGWESFSLLQFTGFVVLVFGTLCFNGVLRPEEWSFVPHLLKEKRDDAEIITGVTAE